MSLEAGTAYVTILPSVKNLGSELNKQVGAQVSKSGTTAGTSFGRSLVTAVGGLAIGATIGATIGAGWSTAMGQELAGVKFTQLLGSAEKAKAYLADLSAFAARTPFDLPGLQDAAGRFLAVGIEADKVIPIMTTLGDVTALMGTGAAGVDRATTALMQMSQKGKISAEEMMQLTEAGIPAWDILAQTMGLSVDQVMDLGQKGKLGRDEVDALFGTIATGGVPALDQFSGGMEKMSQTFSGQWSTLKDTALQTLGGLFTPLLTAGTSVLDWTNNSFIPTLQSVPAFIGRWRTPITVVAGVITAVLMPAMIGWGILTVQNLAKSIASWIAQSAAAATNAAITLVMMTAVGLGYIRLGLQAAAGAARVVAAWLLQKVQMLGAVAMYVVNFAIIAAGWVASGVAAMASALVMAAAWLIGLGPIAWVIAAVLAVIGIFVALWVKCEAFRNFWIGLWNTLVAGVKAAWAWITNVIRTAIALYITVIRAYLAVVLAVWNGIKDAAGAVWTWIKDKISGIVDAVKTKVTEIKTKATEVWNDIKTKATAVWDAIVTAVSDKITEVVTAVGGLKQKVVDKVSGAATWLKSAGSDMINGLLNGAQSILNGIQEWCRTHIYDKIVGSVKSLFGISSPSRVMAALGENVSEGMAVGLRSGQADVDAELRALTSVPGGMVRASFGLDGGGISPARQDIAVRVWIGDRELTDIVRTEVVSEDRRTASALIGGRRAVYA
ncbi:MAG: tape measure protein [Candidatus Nanopelagicales bacterium]